MHIKGLEGVSADQLKSEVSRGGRFVTFDYCISIILMTFRRSLEIHFVGAGEGTVSKSIGYSLTSFVLGWWGFPWGPIYTIGSLTSNFCGGRDVTGEVLAFLDETQRKATFPVADAESAG